MGGGVWSGERPLRTAPTAERVRRQSHGSSLLTSSNLTRPSAHKARDAVKPRAALQGSSSSSKRGPSASSSRRREELRPSDSEDNKENVATSNTCARHAVQPRKSLKLQRRRSGIPGNPNSSRSKADEKGGAAAPAAGPPRIHRELRGLDQATPLKSRRTSAYPPGWTLHQKLDLLLKLGIVAMTEINDSEEVHTLSICGQFAEENHMAMLQDSDRVSHYRKAMHWRGDPSSGGRKLVEGKRVLEIGTGPICLLSINAVNAGAAHVVALEASRPSHCRAKKFVEAIGMSHMIDVVQGYSKRVPREIFKKPQLIIHEIIGDFASQEGVADAILDVQQRTGTHPLSIPYGAETLVCPARLPEPEHFLYPAHSYQGRSILSPRRILLQSVRLNTSHLLLSEGYQAFETLHFQESMDKQMEQKKTLHFTITKPGSMAGLLAVIKIEIYPGQFFGTFRNGETDSWYTSLVLLPEEVNVEPGDRVTLETCADLRNYSVVGSAKQSQKAGSKLESRPVQVSKPTYTFAVVVHRPSFSARRPFKSFAPIVVSFEEQAPVLCGATRKYAERRRQVLRGAAAACCALSLLCSAQAESQMSFTAYRPLQYVAALGFPLGPWGRASLSSAPVSSCEKLLEKIAEGLPTNRRCLCISKATALTPPEVERLLGTNHFLVFLLPPSGVHLDAIGAKQVREIEKMLLDRHSTAAVAFAKETPDLKVLVERLHTDEHAGDLARASLMRPFLSANAQYKQEWQPAPTTKGVNLTAWLKGRPREDGSPSPTLVLVAHHDAFASVPHFALGVSNTGSGTIALMWLARELGKLYKQNQVEFSVAFVLADASALNYEGVAQWMGHADPRLLNATRYVLCLDDVASTSLALHTPKAYKNLETARLLQLLEDMLKAEGVRVVTRTKKISAAGKLLPFWPHEHFTRAKLIAGTLSAEEELKHLWNRSSLADTRLDGVALAKTIRGLTEGIARFLMNVQNIEHRLTHRGSNDHLHVFISSWARLSADTPRQVAPLRRFFAYRNVPAYVGSASGGARYLKSLTDELENAGLSTEQNEFVVDMGGFSFSYEAPVTVHVAEARPAFFDWLLLLGSLAYSAAIFLVIKGISKSEFLETHLPPRESSPGSMRIHSPLSEQQTAAGEPGSRCSSPMRSPADGKDT
ncbi:hypothetical protein Esti_001429 [Eimeria stiedai]